MEFNLNKLMLSHNGQYIMYENTLYDISSDITYNNKNTDINFWLNFLKENSKISYKNQLIDFTSIQKLIRETVYSISEIFDEKNKQLFILEFETKFSNNLIIENNVNQLNIDNMSSSWDFIIESITKVFNLNEQSEDKGFFSNLKDKINAGTDWLMNKGLGWFFENLRKALFSWGGAAIQTFLATSTFGIGNIVLVVVWGAMLAWDILQGINGDLNWVNIIIDLVGVLTTGPGAKIISGVFQKLGLLGSKLPLSGIIKQISTSGSSMVKWFSSMLSNIVSGVSKIGGYMSQGIAWLSKKLGIKSLEKVSGQLSGKLKGLVDDIAKSSTTLKQNVAKSGTSLKNKLAPVGKALASKPGQIAAAAGVTYGLNAALGGDNRILGGAYGNDDIDMASALASSNSKYDLSQLPG
jgi:hypothetical protein